MTGKKSCSPVYYRFSEPSDRVEFHQIPSLATAANTLMSWRVWRERRRSRVRLGGAMAMLTRPDTEIWPPHSLATPRTREETWMECYLLRNCAGV